MFGLYERKSVGAGEVFIKEGEEAYHAYLIQSGSVRVFTMDGEKKVTLAEVDAGNIIGEAALIMNEPRTASVEAIDPTNLVIITREDFDKMMGKSDQTIRSVLKLLTTRVKNQNSETVSIRKEHDTIDPDSALITKSFTRGMGTERKEQFIEQVGPHMSNLIKALKVFKSGD